MPVLSWEYRMLERAIVADMYAVRYYLGDDGQAYCDVVDPDNGYIAYGCLVVGSRTKPINAPDTEWNPSDGVDPKKHPQVLVLRTTPDKQPYVLDLLYNPARLEKQEKSDTDHGTKIKMSNRDHGIGNPSGHRIVVRDDGSSAAAVKNLDVVLGGGVMKVTDGDATESAALAGKVYSIISQIVSVLNDLQAWAQALDTYLIGATAPPSAMASYAAVRPVPRAPTPLAVTLAELQSAVLKLSPRTEEGGGV
jgi:hypothetical protein